MTSSPTFDPTYEFRAPRFFDFANATLLRDHPDNDEFFRSLPDSTPTFDTPPRLYCADDDDVSDDDHNDGKSGNNDADVRRRIAIDDDQSPTKPFNRRANLSACVSTTAEVFENLTVGAFFSQRRSDVCHAPCGYRKRYQRTSAE